MNDISFLISRTNFSHEKNDKIFELQSVIYDFWEFLIQEDLVEEFKNFCKEKGTYKE